MTALAPAAGPAAPPRRRRPRMAWITWRQHRMALAGTGLLLGACALALGITGLRMQSARAALVAHRCPATGIPISSRCGSLVSAFYHAGYPLTGNVQAVAVGLWVLPLLVGMFVGAPLLAREYEAGTLKFAWTQAAGRTRWVVAKLAVLGAALTAAASLFGALAAWWLGIAGQQVFVSRWQPAEFGLTAVTFAGWTLLAFALGVLAGTLLRRTVPAMAATAVAVAALMLITFKKLYGLLGSIAPVVHPTALTGFTPYAAGSPPVTFVAGLAQVTVTPPGSWPLRSWLTGPRGRVIGSLPYRVQNLGLAAENHWLAAHHITLWTAYQPSGRFWLFQAAAGGACLLVALLSAAGTIGLTRRRAA